MMSYFRITYEHWHNLSINEKAYLWVNCNPRVIRHMDGLKKSRLVLWEISMLVEHLRENWSWHNILKTLSRTTIEMHFWFVFVKGRIGFLFEGRMNGENEGNYLFYSLLAVQKVIRKTMGQGEYHQLIKANSVSLIEKKKRLK